MWNVGLDVSGICVIHDPYFYGDFSYYLNGGEIDLMFTMEYGNILDNFDGGELEWMFTQNYDEDIEGENEKWKKNPTRKQDFFCYVSTLSTAQ